MRPAPAGVPGSATGPGTTRPDRVAYGRCDACARSSAAATPTAALSAYAESGRRKKA
ncbi:hypothetical protein [Streptomyces sp. NPDC057747]|uniref:hypothetical protein n=1 Tax=Streptomyces sp. NPDC057747 TaxID=3346238 RepID=UPI0036CD60EE